MDLNSPLYNGEALGSGSAVNAYGGAVVFSGPIGQTVMCSASLSISPVVWRPLLVGALRCIAWLRDEPTHAAPGELFSAVSASCTIMPRMLARLAGEIAPSVVGSLAESIVVQIHDALSLVVSVIGTCAGNDLSITPAPDDRVIYVPANERLSYVSVN